MTNDDHWVHFSQDTINNGKPGKREKVEEAALQALTNTTLELRRNVIIDRMHLDPAQRAYFIAVAQNAGVPAHCCVLQPPTDLLANRVLHRENHIVMGEAGAKMARASANKLVQPKYDEGLQVID